MASFLVPPHGSCIIKCENCHGLYMPSRLDKYAEPCPFCGCKYNTIENTIPVWRYNLIKFFRSGLHVDDIEKNLISFKKENEDDVKRVSPPKSGDYYYTIKFPEKHSFKVYKFYGCVKAYANLPLPRDVNEDGCVYYVEESDVFLTVKDGKWTENNDVEKEIVEPRRSVLLEKMKNGEKSFSI